MTQKPLLWVEVGAHAVRKRSECAGVVRVELWRLKDSKIIGHDEEK